MDIHVILRPDLIRAWERAHSPEHFISLSKEWPQLLISSRVGLQKKVGLEKSAEFYRTFNFCQNYGNILFIVRSLENVKVLLHLIDSMQAIILEVENMQPFYTFVEQVA
jgi:hypothetical protein